MSRSAAALLLVLLASGCGPAQGSFDPGAMRATPAAPAMAVQPVGMRVHPGSEVIFTARAGVAPIRFTLAPNHSGGSINRSTGRYRAGPGLGVDVILTQDAHGALARAAIQVVAAPPPGPDGGCAPSTGCDDPGTTTGDDDPANTSIDATDDSSSTTGSDDWGSTTGSDDPNTTTPSNDPGTTPSNDPGTTTGSDDWGSTTGSDDSSTTTGSEDWGTTTGPDDSPPPDDSSSTTGSDDSSPPDDSSTTGDRPVRHRRHQRTSRRVPSSTSPSGSVSPASAR